MADNGKKDWGFDFGEISSMREYRDVSKRWNDAIRTDDYEAMYAFMARYITAWPFDGDPSDAAGYEDMNPADFGKAMLRMRTEIASFLLKS